MPAKKPPDPNEKPQKQRFVEAAKAAEVDVEKVRPRAKENPAATEEAEALAIVLAIRRKAAPRALPI